jgi:1,4-alpha-glucan branching enzyme
MAKLKKEKVATEERQTYARKTFTKKSASNWGAKKLTSTEVTVRKAGARKEYLESENVCRVTFMLPKVAAPDAESVYVVGDFNDWNIEANRMKKRENGDYTITLDLKPEREYQFRYLINGSRWENDWSADKYVKSPYGDSDNSVIVV